MLQFKQDDTEAELILTLTELVTITEPFYLFVFTHVANKDKVLFALFYDEDQSEYPTRYNQFTINPSTVFAGKQSGEWHYRVYQQETDSTIEPDSTDNLLEYGKLYLDRSTEFEYSQYESTTSYKAYNG